MTAPNYTAADYLGALQSLLPQGRAWPRDPEATQTKVLAGLAAVYERNNARANQMLVDGFPATTSELLPEWESTLGFPDPGVGLAPTIEKRQAVVAARFGNQGGQSAAYFAAYAAQLGFPVQVKSRGPFRMGQSKMGQQLGAPEWVYALKFHVTLTGVEYTDWDLANLQYQMSSIIPAHTVLKFYYL